ncbi:MAG: anaerobic ribonucleoside-triphosphate reductase activating protein [Candidatus Bipolaricaulota bacterium]|nr:anaerobic ribonucleoside-triphosphate reductase activating protein [Candidatus Bipolaricaulota bacterium]
MEIAHLQLPSLVDWPGKVSAVLWTVGCDFRCPFCYNAELVLPELGTKLPRLGVDGLLAQLAARRKLLDGVVVTGGEPTLHPDLPEFLVQVKELGLLVKLDTNGARPDVLAGLLAADLVDHVAVDLKAPFPRYGEFTGLLRGAALADAVARVRESILLVQERAPDYEFRTTAAPGLGPDDLRAVAAEIRGARRYVLQPFFAPAGKRLVDEGWRTRPALSVGELRALAFDLGTYVPTEVRG